MSLCCFSYLCRMWSSASRVRDCVTERQPPITGRFHLVAAKIGGTIARAFAARRPQRVKTLTVVGTPAPLRLGVAERAPMLRHELETHGVEQWARQNMGDRLGSAFPSEGVAWWIQFMGRTALSTQLGFMATIACADTRDHHGEQRPRFGGRHARLAAADPEFGAGGAARRFVSRGRHAC